MIERRRLVWRLSIMLLVLAILVPSCAKETQPTEMPSEEPPGPGAVTEEPQAPETEPPKEDVVVYVAAHDDLINLDPAKTTQAGDRTLAQNIYSGLVTFEPGTTDVVPDLAEEWTISDDGLVYTFKLRQGVQFHGGYGEMTANDVKFSFERHFDESVGSANSSDLAVVDTIDVLDPYTLRITLKGPTPGFLVRLAWQSAFVVSEKAMKDLGEDFGFNPIGTGPYAFSSWTPGQEIVLVANEDYHTGAPKVDRLVFKVIKEETVALLAFESGEVDVVPIKQLGAFRQVGETEGAQVTIAPSSCVYLFYINNTLPPFDDVRVRQALNYALNKDVLVETVDHMISASPSILSPMLTDFTADVQTYEYNLEKAKELLDAAGVPEGFEITLNYTQAYLYEELVLTLKDSLATLGLNVQAVPVERAVVTSIRKDKTYQILPGSITRFDTDQYLSSFFKTGASSNHPGYSNTEVDGLIEAARAETDPAKRKEIYIQIQQIIAQDAPVIPVGTCDAPVVSRESINGLYGHPYEGLLDFEFVWVE